MSAHRAVAAAHGVGAYLVIGDRVLAAIHHTAHPDHQTRGMLCLTAAATLLTAAHVSCRVPATDQP